MARASPVACHSDIKAKLVSLVYIRPRITKFSAWRVFVARSLVFCLSSNFQFKLNNAIILLVKMTFTSTDKQSAETLPSNMPLGGSLYGKSSLARLINVFVVCCDYAGLYWMPATRERPMLIYSEKDLESVQSWIKQFESGSNVNWNVLLNKEVTGKNLVTLLDQVGSSIGCSVVYLSGHAMSIGRSFMFLPANCVENNEISSERGILAGVMRTLLLPKVIAGPSILLLVTDFCFADNFLGLPYVLSLEPNKPPVWSDSGGVSTLGVAIRDGDRRILHFAGAAEMKPTYGTKVGGCFTKAFCSVSPNESISLADRVRRIQQKLDTIARKWDPDYHQQVQLYSSHKWDLSSTDTLEAYVSGA